MDRTDGWEANLFLFTTDEGLHRAVCPIFARLGWLMTDVVEKESERVCICERVRVRERE